MTTNSEVVLHCPKCGQGRAVTPTERRRKGRRARIGVACEGANCGASFGFWERLAIFDVFKGFQLCSWVKIALRDFSEYALPGDTISVSCPICGKGQIVVLPRLSQLLIIPQMTRITCGECVGLFRVGTKMDTRDTSSPIGKRKCLYIVTPDLRAQQRLIQHRRIARSGWFRRVIV